MAITLRTASTEMGVTAVPEASLQWTDTNKPGLRLRAARASRESGNFLGYLSFDSHVKTGLHQHLGPAFSYFLQGGLADFQGFARIGDMGVNLAGATHDAMAYAPTLMASRLDAPVIYPTPDAVVGETAHTGARAGIIVNARPEVMPDINIAVDALPWGGTRHGGVQRRDVFDYAGTGLVRRCIQLRLLPGSAIGPLEASAGVDVFVVGGDLTSGREHAGGGDFMIIEPGARFSLASSFGCLAFLWVDGPIRQRDTGDVVLAPF